jgi:hypothetical protein
LAHERRRNECHAQRIPEPAGPHVCGSNRERRFTLMLETNLYVWMPAMFVLGLVSMGLCYLFLKACEKI